MSISSMTNLAVARRNDNLGMGHVPQSAQDIATATAGAPSTENQLTATLKSIASYIPTELIALYLAALAAVRSGVQPVLERELADRAGTLTLPSEAEMAAVVVFAALTPLFVWAVYAGRVKTAGKRLPLAPRLWPWWEMIAATLAFLAWAFALPESPFVRFSWYNVTWAAFVVLVVSTLLGLLAPLVQRQLKT